VKIILIHSTFYQLLLMKKSIANQFHWKLILLDSFLFLLFLTGILSNASAQNLITNGDFEATNGISFFGYNSNYQSNLTGNSSPGQFVLGTNTASFNPNFAACSDHTQAGVGLMMIADGSNNAGDKVWEQKPGGGIQVIAGNKYSFSYWITSISNTNAPGNYPEIEVQINGSSIGSAVCSPILCGWKQVLYTFTAPSNYVQIWLFDKQTSSVGNDFALDDLSLIEIPPPLDIRYSVSNTSCPGYFDGAITVYGYGGIPPYAYSIDGGAYTGNNIFVGLDTTKIYTISVRDAATPTPATVSNSTVKIGATVNPLLVIHDTTVCKGSPVQLFVTGGTSGYTPTPWHPIKPLRWS
jgi:hypothetical protein